MSKLTNSRMTTNWCHEQQWVSKVTFYKERVEQGNTPDRKNNMARDRKSQGN